MGMTCRWHEKNEWYGDVGIMGMTKEELTNQPTQEEWERHSTDEWERHYSTPPMNQ
jgi:hypothetical protein